MFWKCSFQVWHVVKFFLQKLSSCEKVGWQTQSYQIFWFKNCLVIQYFSQTHSVKENTKLPILSFLRCKKLQKLIFRKQGFLQNLICEKKQVVFKIWCVVKLLIQNLNLLAKFNLNLARVKIFDSKSDTLSKISIKNVFRIHFVWQPSFLKKHRKGYSEVFTVYFDIFFENQFRNRIWLHKNNYTRKSGAL